MTDILTCNSYYYDSNWNKDRHSGYHLIAMDILYTSLIYVKLTTNGSSGREPSKSRIHKKNNHMHMHDSTECYKKQTTAALPKTKKFE